MLPSGCLLLHRIGYYNNKQTNRLLTQTNPKFQENIMTKVAKHLHQRILINPQWDEDLKYLAGYIADGSVTDADYEYFIEELAYCTELPEAQVLEELRAYLVENYVNKNYFYEAG